MTACEAFGCNEMFPSARYEVPSTVPPEYANLQSGVRMRNRIRSVLDPSRMNLDEEGRGTTGGETPASPGRYGGDGDEVRWEPSSDEPEDSAWGAEPEGWRLSMQRPPPEAVLSDFYGSIEAEDAAAGAAPTAGARGGASEADAAASRAQVPRGYAAPVPGTERQMPTIPGAQPSADAAAAAAASEAAAQDRRNTFAGLSGRG